MSTPSLLFHDQAGAQVGMNRLYGWASLGEQAIITAETRSKRLSIAGTMALDGPRGMMTYEGAFNTDTMVDYISNHLDIRPGEILVTDGLTVHKTERVREALEKKGATLLVLPPYSPDLNPIEHLWSTLKARLRAVGSASIDELSRQVHEIWKNMEGEFFPNWIENCGYPVAAST